MLRLIHVQITLRVQVYISLITSVQITVKVHLKSKCTLDMIYDKLHSRSGRPSSVTLGVTLNLDRRGDLESKQRSNMGVSKYHNSEFDLGSNQAPLNCQEEGSPGGLQYSMKINI